MGGITIFCGLLRKRKSDKLASMMNKNRCPKCLGKRKDTNGNWCDYCGGKGSMS